MEKKRELLPQLNSLIISLAGLSADAAKLEYMDNDKASRRLKRELVDIEKNQLQAFKKAIISTRHEINILPRRKKSINNIKNQTHESESEPESSQPLR